MGRREEPLDPAAGPVQGFAHALRERRRAAGNPTYRQLARKAGYSAVALSGAARGLRLPSLPVTLAYVAACGGTAQDLEEWEQRWRAVTAEVRAAAAWERDGADTDPPYRGLARFEAEHSALFFGRDQLVTALTGLVAAHRCVVVVGPSGSGKSSLLRAGLIPRLRQPPRDGARDPGPRLAALRVLTPGGRSPETLRRALTPAGGDGETCVVVDQFEEVFTLCPDPAERDAVLEAVLAADAPGSSLRVVLGLRADFYGRCLEHPGLTAVLRRAALPVGPMSPRELRRAVVGPATAHGFFVERALTEHLVTEAAGEPGALPLLSHALLETWRRRTGRTLTLDAHREAGGLHGAIAQTAEELHAGLTPESAALARRILLRLVTPGAGTTPDTRRPADRAELEALGEDAAEVLHRLAQARLITLDEDTADLAHEALLTSWARLRGWIAAERDRLRTHRRLTQATRAWQDLGRDGGALYRGALLAAARRAFPDPADLTPDERAFLTASRAARARGRALRRAALAGACLAVVLALLAGAVAWQQGRESDRRRTEAAARRVASLVDSVHSADPALAMRLATAAWRLSPSTETRAAVTQAATRPERDTLTVTRTGQPFLSADGGTLVLAGEDDVQRWDVSTHRRELQAPGVRYWAAHDVSADGRRLLMRWTDGNLLLRNVDRDTPTGTTFPARAGTRQPLAWFTASGRAVAVRGDASVQLWDARTRRVLFRRAVRSPGFLAVSADDRLLAFCTASREFQVWDAGTGRRVTAGWARAAAPVGCPAQTLPFAFGFSPDRRGFVVATPASVRRWDLASGSELPAIPVHGAARVAFSGTGSHLVTYDGQAVQVWRVQGRPRPVARLPEAHRSVRQLRVDERRGLVRYLTQSQETVSVRTVAFDDRMASRWRPSGAFRALVSPDGERLATAWRRGDVMEFTVRDTDGGHELRLPRAQCVSRRAADECQALMTFGPDGGTFAYGTNPGLIRNDPRARVRTQEVTVWDLVGSRALRRILLVTGEAPVARALALERDGAGLQVYYPEQAWWERLYPRTGTLSAAFAGHGSQTDGVGAALGRSADLHPGGRALATIYGRAVVFDAQGRPTTDRRLSMGTTVRYSPTGDQLASGDAEGNVYLWDGDVTTRTAILEPPDADHTPGGGSPVTALAFSPDGTTLAVATSPGTLRLWDIPTRRPLGSPLPTSGDTVLDLRFSDDGGRLVAAGAHVPLRTYTVQPDRLASTLCARAGGGLTERQWDTYLPDVPYRETY